MIYDLIRHASPRVIKFIRYFSASRNNNHPFPSLSRSTYPLEKKEREREKKIIIISSKVNLSVEKKPPHSFPSPQKRSKKNKQQKKKDEPENRSQLLSACILLYIQRTPLTGTRGESICNKQPRFRGGREAWVCLRVMHSIGVLQRFSFRRSRCRSLRSEVFRLCGYRNFNEFVYNFYKFY